MTNNFNSLSLVVLLFIMPLVINAQTQKYSLLDFYKNDTRLDSLVDSVFNTMTEKERVAQMIITSAGENGKPAPTVERLIKNKMVGGVIFMKGGKETHKNRANKFNRLASESQSVPLLFSMDAEPSLLNRRIIGSPKVDDTYSIKTIEQCDAVTHIINKELRYIGIKHNYAPVLDISVGNAAIKKRSYGNDPYKVRDLANVFIQNSQYNGIIATAKHFPGHGLVKGDTHTQSVYIDGEMKEVENYQPIIDAGVLTIMVAHIVVKNNKSYSTDGKPATLSRKIVTDLLKNKMNFKGLVITDAMNIMKAVTIYEDAPLQASKAGCDLLLMPKEEAKAINSILKEMSKSAPYKQQVNESIKKILRMKICAGLL